MSRVHKKYLRSFIPRSYRPYVQGVSLDDPLAAPPVAAILLDYTQRQKLINTPGTTLEFSDKGAAILHQLKTDLLCR